MEAIVGLKEASMAAKLAMDGLVGLVVAGDHL